MPTDDRHAALAQTLIATVLTQPGVVTPQLRTQIEIYVARLCGLSAAEFGDLPSELCNYVNKVALHAYQVSDEDTSALLKVGYSEDAIFEITVSAALGAGIAHLQKGLDALKGKKYAS